MKSASLLTEHIAFILEIYIAPLQEIYSEANKHDAYYEGF